MTLRGLAGLLGLLLLAGIGNADAQQLGAPPFGTPEYALPGASGPGNSGSGNPGSGPRALVPAFSGGQQAAPQFGPQQFGASPRGDAIHLGVASCAGSSCHSAPEQPVGSNVVQNEFAIWSTRDKHRNAYTVLLQDRAIKMAKALGYPDAANQKICLDCHADNVPPSQRGRGFQLSDGVGCEACHGGASNWLGIHISGVSHQANLAAGMYPTEKPVARADKCLTCHFGDETKFVNHRLYGAGHPRLSFELDTYTQTEPAHYVVDQDYIQRKGRITDVQVWAAGQAIDIVARMDALLSQKNGHQGIFPEPALFDCQSCHHPYDSLHAPRPTTTGLGPGTVKLYDADTVMLRIAGQRADPGIERDLGGHMEALHRATNDNWSVVQQQAGAVRRAAAELATALSNRVFTREDLQAIASGLIAAGLNVNDLEFSHAEQTTMALESVVNDMRKAGYLAQGEDTTARTALSGLYEAFANEQTYRPGAYQKALREFQRVVVR